MPHKQIVVKYDIMQEEKEFTKESKMNEYYAVACLDSNNLMHYALIYDEPRAAQRLASLLADHDGDMLDPAFDELINEAVDPFDIGLSSIDWSRVRSSMTYNDMGFDSVYEPDNRNLHIYLMNDNNGEPYRIRR